MISTVNLWMVLVCLIAFVGVVGITKYVSLGSLVVIVIYFAEIVIYGQMGKFGMPSGALYEMYAVAAFLMVLAFL